jgi:hypothetical protein
MTRIRADVDAWSVKYDPRPSALSAVDSFAMRPIAALSLLYFASQEFSGWLDGLLFTRSARSHWLFVLSAPSPLL